MTSVAPAPTKNIAIEFDAVSKKSVHEKVSNTNKYL